MSIENVPASFNKFNIRSDSDNFELVDQEADMPLNVLEMELGSMIDILWINDNKDISEDLPDMNISLDYETDNSVNNLNSEVKLEVFAEDFADRIFTSGDITWMSLMKVDPDEENICDHSTGSVNDCDGVVALENKYNFDDEKKNVDNPVNDDVIFDNCQSTADDNQRNVCNVLNDEKGGAKKNLMVDDVLLDNSGIFSIMERDCVFSEFEERDSILLGNDERNKDLLSDNTLMDKPVDVEVILDYYLTNDNVLLTIHDKDTDGDKIGIIVKESDAMLNNDESSIDEQVNQDGDESGIIEKESDAMLNNDERSIDEQVNQDGDESGIIEKESDAMLNNDEKSIDEQVNQDGDESGIIGKESDAMLNNDEKSIDEQVNQDGDEIGIIGKESDAMLNNGERSIDEQVNQGSDLPFNIEKKVVNVLLSVDDNKQVNNSEGECDTKDLISENEVRPRLTEFSGEHSETNINTVSRFNSDLKLLHVNAPVAFMASHRIPYLTAIFQLLYSCTEFREQLIFYHNSDSIVNFDADKQSEEMLIKRLFTNELCKLFWKAYSKKINIREEFQFDGLVNRFCSVQECYRRILNSITSVMEANDETNEHVKDSLANASNTIKNLFYGKMVSKTWCTNCQNICEEKRRDVELIPLKCSLDSHIPIRIQKCIDDFFGIRKQTTKWKNNTCCDNATIVSQHRLTGAPRYMLLYFKVPIDVCVGNSSSSVKLSHEMRLPVVSGQGSYGLRGVLSRLDQSFSVDCLYDGWWKVRDYSVKKTAALNLVTDSMVAIFLQRMD